MNDCCFDQGEAEKLKKEYGDKWVSCVSQEWRQTLPEHGVGTGRQVREMATWIGTQRVYLEQPYCHQAPRYGEKDVNVDMDKKDCVPWSKVVSTSCIVRHKGAAEDTKVLQVGNAPGNWRVKEGLG